MAGGVIGSLRVDLGMNSAQFHKGIRKAESRLQKFGNFAKKAVAGIGIAFTAVTLAVGKTSKTFIDNADKVAKLSRGIGVTTEYLSQMGHAAELSGMTMDDFGKGMASLSKAMSDSLMSSTSAQAVAFDRLGISVLDAQGNLRPASDVLDEMSNKFAKMKDGTDKTALSATLLGKKLGTKFIPMLNQGSQGMASMRAEADALGKTISERTAVASELFNDNLTRLKAAKDGFVKKLTEKVLPSLVNLSESFLDNQEASGLAADAIQVLSVVFKGALTGVAVLVGGLTALAQTIRAVAKAAHLAAKGDFSEAWDQLKSGWGDVAKTAEKTADRIKGIWSDEVLKAPKLPDQTAFRGTVLDKDVVKKMGDATSRTAKKVSKDITDHFGEAVKSLNGQIADIQMYTKSLGLTAAQSERLAASTQIYNQLQAQGIVLTQSQTAELELLLNNLQGVVEKQEFVEEATIRTADAFGAMFDNVLETGKFKMSALLDIVQSTLKDMASAAFKSGVTQIFGSIFGSIGGGGPTNIIPKGLFQNAQGNAFNQGKVIPFASGGVVNMPTLFPMNDNKTGLMGEAGPEAIMPLKRAANGDLGIQASGMGGTHIENHFHIDARGAVEGTAEQIRKAIAAETPKIVNQSVSAVRQKNKNNGGKYV